MEQPAECGTRWSEEPLNILQLGADGYRVTVRRISPAPLATLMSALACVFVVTLAPAGALAAGPSPVPLPGFFDMAVDNVHQHVFVSAGPGGPGVAVLGFDGSLLRIIEPKGASGLALDAGELYVAASDAAEIDVVDTATLSVTGSIPLGDWTQPGDVLIANGLVWFFGQLPGVTIVELASVRPDGTEAPHGAAGPVGGTSPRFVEGAGGDEFLYVFDLSAHPAIYRYKIVGADVGDQLPQDSSMAPGGNGSRSAVFVPGRDTILMGTGRTAPPAYGEANAVTEVSTQTLVSVMSYPVPPTPMGVAATSARGGLLAATTWSGSSAPMIWVFRPGNAKPTWSTSVPGPYSSLLPAWSGDGRSLFVIGFQQTALARDFLVVRPFTAALAGKRGSLPRWLPIVALCLSAGLGVLVAYGAKSKGYGPLWLWWAFGFLAFLISVIVLVLLPNKARRESDASVGPPDSPLPSSAAPPIPPPIPPPPPPLRSANRPVGSTRR